MRSLRTGLVVSPETSGALLTDDYRNQAGELASRALVHDKAAEETQSRTEKRRHRAQSRLLGDAAAALLDAAERIERLEGEALPHPQMHGLFVCPTCKGTIRADGLSAAIEAIERLLGHRPFDGDLGRRVREKLEA